VCAQEGYREKELSVQIPLTPRAVTAPPIEQKPEVSAVLQAKPKYSPVPLMKAVPEIAPAPAAPETGKEDVKEEDGKVPWVEATPIPSPRPPVTPVPTPEASPSPAPTPAATPTP
jgi:hypothetical protein